MLVDCGRVLCVDEERHRVPNIKSKDVTKNMMVYLPYIECTGKCSRVDRFECRISTFALFAHDVRLVGCFGFNGPLRQYFSLYRAVSQREGEREEKG